MNEISGSDSYEVASERLDRALGRLETGVQGLGERAQSLAVVERDRQQLRVDRGRLATELDRVNEKVEVLDESAAEVSRRLVDAMETVKTVLTK